MSVYLESKADLLLAFQKKTGLSFTLADLIFSKPAVNDNPAFTQNTKVRISIVPTHATHQGSEIFYFNRLALSQLASYPAPDYPPVAITGVSVYTLLQAIKSAMGLSFTTDDLVETFVQGEAPNQTVLLKAKTTSLGWTGEFTLPLGAPPLLSTLFSKDTIDWI
jgi:hypothetical protein